ncbi:MAG: hypothetical protein AAF714_03600 [Pseudomonadota bacterium]
MLQQIFFFFCLAVSGASFVLFAALVWKAANETPVAPAAPPPSGAGGMQPQSLDVTKVISETGKLGSAFAKAGPIATCASLSVFFAVLALATSGVVEITLK